MVTSEELQEIAAFSDEELRQLFTDVFQKAIDARGHGESVTAIFLQDTFAVHVDQMLFQIVSMALEDLIS